MNLSLSYHDNGKINRPEFTHTQVYATVIIVIFILALVAYVNKPTLHIKAHVEKANIETKLDR